MVHLRNVESSVIELMTQLECNDVPSAVRMY